VSNAAITVPQCPARLETSTLPFPDYIPRSVRCWQGPEWVRRHAELLEELANARGAADLAPDVADVEAVLHEQGVLVPEWAERWRERWRASLAASTTAHTVLLHVAALQARAASLVIVIESAMTLCGTTADALHNCALVLVSLDIASAGRMLHFTPFAGFETASMCALLRFGMRGRSLCRRTERS